MISAQTVFLQIGLSLMVAVATAFLTVWLSLRRFYREKWWEAKMQAYTDILQALHHMRRDLSISMQAELEGRETETDFHKESSSKHQAAWDEIRKQIDVGEFLFSPTSTSILVALSSEAEHDPNDGYFEHLEKINAAVEKCLPAIKTAARSDLGLPAIEQSNSNHRGKKIMLSDGPSDTNQLPLRASTESRIEMFKAVAAFEHLALKTCFILNGGGLIALVAFLGNILGNGHQDKLDVDWLYAAMAGWACGLLVAAVAHGSGYWSQVSHFRATGRVTDAQAKKYEKLGAVAQNVAYALFVVSLFAFAFGSFCVLLSLP